MDKNEKKRNGKRRIIKKPSGLGGLRGGAPRFMPPPYSPRRTYERVEQKQQPKEERSHWNGKVETWTEPQKPKQEKIIKYEVNTDQLLNDLARQNSELIERISSEVSRDGKAEDSLQNNHPEIQTEPITESGVVEEAQTEAIEAEPQQTEKPAESIEQQEASLEPLDAPELVYMSPSFWETLESELSKELEQIESVEAPTEECEPCEEGY